MPGKCLIDFSLKKPREIIEEVKLNVNVNDAVYKTPKADDLVLSDEDMQSFEIVSKRSSSGKKNNKNRDDSKKRQWNEFHTAKDDKHADS